MFVSSIGVYGVVTRDVPLSIDSEVKPHSPYAVSKLEAEMGF